MGGEVEQRRHGVLLRLLCVRAEQRDERLDGTCLGEGDLVVDVVARERLERGRRVLLRDLRAAREEGDERRDAARPRDERLVVLGLGEVPQRLGRLLVRGAGLVLEQLQQRRDAALLGDDDLVDGMVLGQSRQAARRHRRQLERRRQPRRGRAPGAPRAARPTRGAAESAARALRRR